MLAQHSIIRDGSDEEDFFLAVKHLIPSNATEIMINRSTTRGKRVAKSSGSVDPPLDTLPADNSATRKKHSRYGRLLSCHFLNIPGGNTSTSSENSPFPMVVSA